MVPVIRLLVEGKASVVRRIHILASRAGCCMLLFMQDVVGDKIECPLAIAAAAGQVANMQALVEAKADLNTRSKVPTELTGLRPNSSAGAEKQGHDTPALGRQEQPEAG